MAHLRGHYSAVERRIILSLELEITKQTTHPAHRHISRLTLVSCSLPSYQNTTLFAVKASLPTDCNCTRDTCADTRTVRLARAAAAE